MWEKDDEGLFCQNFKLSELYISYDIWHILPREYNIEYNDSQELLKNIMYDYTNKGKLKINN